MSASDRIPDEDVPDIIPWPDLQKRAEREGVDIMDYVNGLNAHVQRQRDALSRLSADNTKLRTWLAAALSFVPDHIKVSELRDAVEKVRG